MKICIYGGSFNPPHLGHTAALRAVRAAIRPDLTLVIPDRIPPHKELTAGSPEPAERLLMTMMAFADEPGVEVSDMELHRSGKSYTARAIRTRSCISSSARICSRRLSSGTIFGICSLR